ncbi:hypothetical protein G4Y79_20090 [Phototrophicus methaneseepsis]|uniref:Uncharacterized protein n=1 Tax=Phototrophicus methaneseepsis TaxID=2710758 RepID=A0A7S8E7W0_9CHLR|nr:hypothetical protein [Phototrophicus methaneseepsis]QPC81965.1 hypothetical protein G4Y79_20090 [Phototrophicus methaneseepsis]
MYASNDILFPYEAISALRNIRGPIWASLVDDVVERSQTHERVLAFMLMMIRLNDCLHCETDSYRAMRGCDNCSIQTLKRYKGKDEELLALFNTALDDVRLFAAQEAGSSIADLILVQVDNTQVDNTP